MAMLLASAIGSADVDVAAQRQRPDGGQPQADIPEAFRFLFHSPDQHAREVAKRPTYLVYEEELWKALPYDSISLERGSIGCAGACPSTTVTLYRATYSGTRTPGAGELRGRAEFRTVGGAGDAPRISEGAFRINDFANLSYLLHRVGFLGLPARYDCTSCAADRRYAALSVAAGETTKMVIDYGVSRPVELWVIQQAVDSVSRNIQWTQK
jgi:hypothetical protein